MDSSVHYRVRLLGKKVAFTSEKLKHKSSLNIFTNFSLIILHVSNKL